MPTTDTDNNEATGTLTHCPFCRYNLQGLPRNYRCPECGFEYDESMQAWGYRLSLFRKCLRYLEFVFMVLFASLMIFFLFIRARNASQFLAVLIVGLGIIAISWLIRKGPLNLIVVASREGIIISNWGKVEKLPWHTFWIPNPENPKEIPPWAEQWNEDLRYRNGLMDILFRVRPDMHSRRAAVYKALVVKWYLMRGPYNDSVSLEKIGNRKARKAMMRELRRRWEEANANDGVVHQSKKNNIASNAVE